MKRVCACVDKRAAGTDEWKQNRRRQKRLLVGAKTEFSLWPNHLIHLGPFHNGGNDPLRIALTDVEGGRSIW